MRENLKAARLAEQVSAFLMARNGRLASDVAGPLQAHLAGLCLRGEPPPRRGRGVDWGTLARDAGVDEARLRAARRVLGPGLEALRRQMQGAPLAARRRSAIPQRPEPLFLDWEDPPQFHRALDLHMRRHADNPHRLRRALLAQGASIDETSLGTWLRGRKAPTHRRSLAVLGLLEARWRLPPGYFRAKLPHRARATQGARLAAPDLARRPEVAWHLPDDFDRRPRAEQAEILDWVRRVAISGSTGYRRFHARSVKHPYALRFEGLQAVRKDSIRAPDALCAEVAGLVAFKTSELTPIGLRRTGAWGAATAGQQAAHLGLMLGALAAHPAGPARGLGVPAGRLTLALLAFPRVWDWYLEWRRARRGFYTRWERNMAMLGAALTHPETGWLTQSPALAGRLTPIAGLVSGAEIAEARADWPGACAALHGFAGMRAREIARLSRVHHEPFEPILPVLEAASPVGEYRRIADEVLRLAPCPLRHPIAAAESARANLMIRLGLHLGFRQRNLRELLVCPRGGRPRTEHELTGLRRAELRWSPRLQAWEVTAPPAAFKNARSSFFTGGPFRLTLPDVAGLYPHIEDYLARHRPVLLGRGEDPGTFFVKTRRSTSETAEYDTHGFYLAWRAITQRYGVRNPWTGRGAIEGLLPHGPHKVRDVLATHVLKQTGSYEQASYAIQDTPKTVAQHYGRFLPRDKAAIAAQVLNRAWEDG